MPVAALHTELGHILLHKGHIETNQLKLAREVSKNANRELGLVIMDLGFSNIKQVTEARALVQGVPFVDVAKRSIEATLVRKIPEATLRQHNVLPIERLPSGQILVAVAYPDMVIGLMRQFERDFGCKVSIGLGVAADMLKVLDRMYGNVKATR